MSFNFYLAEKDLRIEVGDVLIQNMVLLARDKYPNEYGGLLIGYYTSEGKKLIITDVLLPETYRSTPVFFERDTCNLEESLQKFYSTLPAKYYVGEWHTHPNGGTLPSRRDVQGMRTIINSKDVSIDKPVLCIIGFNEQTFSIGFHLIMNNKILTYEQQDTNR